MEYAVAGLVFGVLGWLVYDLRALRKAQTEDFRLILRKFAEQKDLCHEHRRQTDTLEHIVAMRQGEIHLNGGRR